MISFLNEELLRTDSGIELVDVSFYESDPVALNRTVDIIEDMGEKVILLTDSLEGNTIEHESVVRAMSERKKRPFILVTHIENARYDLKECALGPTMLVEYFAPRADWYHNTYDSLLFNYTRRKFSKVDGDKEGDMGVFRCKVIAFTVFSPAYPLLMIGTSDDTADMLEAVAEEVVCIEKEA